jgi:predicted  nucleic acid-binding Zn-ribbon protein
MDDIEKIEKLDEKLFELRQENQHLRGQITYLQEELSSTEDDRDKQVARLQAKVDELEQQLGEALFVRKD